MSRFWIILSIVIVAMVGLFFVTKKDPANSVITGDPKVASSTDHVRGDGNAPVTLIEYGDFQCPACGSFYPIIKSLETTYKGKVKFVFRNFPLSQIHPNAFAAARAAEAAELQGKFFEMHDKLYETQSAWGETTTNQQSLFESYAKEIGLNMDKFKADYVSSQVADKINADINTGTQAFSINSTPTFVLQGEKIDNPQDIDGFRTLIDAQLVKAGAAVPEK